MIGKQRDVRIGSGPETVDRLRCSDGGSCDGEHLLARATTRALTSQNAKAIERLDQLQAPARRRPDAFERDDGASVVRLRASNDPFLTARFDNGAGQGCRGHDHGECNPVARTNPQTCSAFFERPRRRSSRFSLAAIRLSQILQTPWRLVSY